MSSLLAKLLAQIIRTASPAIVNELQQLIAGLKQKAAATPNPWDDILCELLELIIGKPGVTK